jgi:hypothetical protein
MTLLRRCLLIAGLGLLVPVTNCTLITDVDRSLIGADDTDAASGGTGGTGGTGGAGGTGGSAGADAPDDGITTNGDSTTDVEVDDADTDATD